MLNLVTQKKKCVWNHYLLRLRILIYISCLLLYASAARSHGQPFSKKTAMVMLPSIESFVSHFKSEMFYLSNNQTKGELIQAIETYIYHY